MTSFNCGRVAQSVEHLTARQDVMGSIPMPDQYSGLKVQPACCPANFDHDAAYDDDGLSPTVSTAVG